MTHVQRKATLFIRLRFLSLHKGHKIYFSVKTLILTVKLSLVCLNSHVSDVLPVKRKTFVYVSFSRENKFNSINFSSLRLLREVKNKGKENVSHHKPATDLLNLKKRLKDSHVLLYLGCSET